MQSGLDLRPVPPEVRRASVLDVLLLFAGANIVTTTLVTGGSLAPAFSFPAACALILAGVTLGSFLLATLARLGPRYGLPSMVLLRHPFGTLGAAGISWLLIVTNFAWIALNNVIAARAMARVAGGPEVVWNVGVGAVAVVVALFGPRAMALFDRFAVPLLLLVGVGLTASLFGGAGRRALEQPGDGSLSLLAGFDLVIGYLVSWCLMFADYTRFQREEGAASRAVFGGMAITSVWLMALGAGAGLLGGGNDPTDMVLGAGLPLAALVLMALSTITTNFVNLFLSALALKNLWPTAPDRATVLGVGAIGTGLGLVSPQILDLYAAFMGYLGTALLPIVAVVLVHFFSGPRITHPLEAPRLRLAAVVSWLLGAAVYQGIQLTPWPFGATLPTLATTALLYAALRGRSQGGS